MFGINYDTWKEVCNMYFSLSRGVLRSYLQWFPFTKLSQNDKKYIKSEEFFYKYINNPAFILFPNTTIQTENFLQKSDGSFRDASLISPLLYLVLQSVGKEIFDTFVSNRPTNGVSVYYAGNYSTMNPRYKQDYDNFYKELNSSIDSYQYFIKTDITNFYSSININKLISDIDTKCNSCGNVFSQGQLFLFKELLNYCGNGRFPLIENSIASSYLSTVVYLDDIDTRLYKYIEQHINGICEFRIVRYVDDMYILIKSEAPIAHLHDVYNEIRNEYSSILKEYGLSINSKKSCFKKTKDISEELKKSLYDEYFNGEKHNIEDFFYGTLEKFITELSTELLYDSIDTERYNELINKHFSSEDIEFTANEVFNYFIYEDEKESRSDAVVQAIINLVNKSVSFISLDPKRLTIMIVKTENERAIKSFLNQLFVRERMNKWNSYDTSIAIAYLIQRQFKHPDLLNILSHHNKELYSYYSTYCGQNFIESITNKIRNKLINYIAQDNGAYYLYFMYLCEIKKANYMAAFAYFKNFFDRITADIAFISKPQARLKSPNYEGFYTKSQLTNFYKEIPESDKIIADAHHNRNENPLSHASADLLNKDNTVDKIKKSIINLKELVLKYIDLQPDLHPKSYTQDTP